MSKTSENLIKLQERGTQYPGAGLTADVEAFNAYKHWFELSGGLSEEAYVDYDKLVRAYNAEQRHSCSCGARIHR